MRFLNPGSFGIVILCFFLPFINIKCNGVKLASVTGVQLATGTNVGGGSNVMGQKLPSSSSESSDSDSGSKSKKLFEIPLLITLVVLLAAGIAVLVLTMQNKDERVIRKWAVAGHSIALFLLIAEIAKLEYGLSEMNKSSEFGPINISWHLDTGYFLALLITAGFVVYNAMQLRKPPIVIPITDNTAPQPGDNAPTQG